MSWRTYKPDAQSLRLSHPNQCFKRPPFPPFYRALLVWLGYRVVDESPGYLGAGNGTTDLWIIQSEKTYGLKKFHRKSPGLNHLAFRVSSQAMVRKFAREFLGRRKIKCLYGGPRSFPEYQKGYYAVYFEDPDRIKLEVTYIPPRGSK